MSTRKHINDFLSSVSGLFKLTRVLNRPSRMVVEPTNYCNLSCPLCPTGSKTLEAPKGYMDLDKYKALVDELKDCLRNIEFCGYGEPLLNQNIDKMISHAVGYGIHTMLVTNGQLLRKNNWAEKLVDSGLNKIKISLDGLSQETLSKYRVNASFDELMEGIQKINEAKERRNTKFPIILLQFIVMRHNEHEVPLLKDFGKKLKAKIKLKTLCTKQIYQASEFLPKDQKYSRYDFNESKKVLDSKIKQPDVCVMAWTWAHVNWDGSVVPCCKDPHRKHEIGNTFAVGSFLDIWNSPAYVKFRKELLCNRKKLFACKNCVLPPAGKILR